MDASTSAALPDAILDELESVQVASIWRAQTLTVADAQDGRMRSAGRDSGSIGSVATHFPE